MNRTCTIYLGLFLFLCSQLASAHSAPQVKKASKETAQYLVSMPGLGTFLIQADGEERIYYHQGIHIAPRVSPDKSQILLHSKRDGRIGIWLGDLEGKGLQRLCDGDQANWSPDSKEIVFRRGGRILQRVLATGEEETTSPSELSGCKFPSYLSKHRVLFVSQESIYVTEGASRRSRLVAGGEIRSAPRASPDGLKVVWQDGSHLFLFNLRSEKITRLTTQGGIQSWPVWSEDGEYLAYSQSPHPSGPWDLYVTASVGPGKSWLIRRNTHPRIDWCGPYRPHSDFPAVVEHHLAVDSSESGDVSIENRWFTAVHSPRQNTIRMFMKEGTGEDPSLVISPVSANQRPESKPQIRLASWDKDERRLSLLNEAGDSNPGSIVVSFSRYRPMIEVQCTESGSVLLNTNTRWALIPDRLANDLLLDPSDYDSSTITLPYSPLLMAPLQDNSATMLIITPDVEQRIELRSGPNSFERIVVSPRDEKVYIVLLETRDSWHDVRVLPSDSAGSWKAEWTHPFLAQWRFAAAGKGQGYSRTWGEESINLNRSSFLPIDNSFTVQPDPSVVYLFGRSSHTPLDVITPFDFLVDALGVDQGCSLLDESGIRSYRAANWPSSFSAITTRDEEWSRELVHVDSRDPNWVDLGVLESMQGLRAVDTPGVKLLITHFGEDIIGILEGLEERITEYQSFVDKLAVFCRSSATHTNSSERFLSTMDEQLADLMNKVGRMPVSSNRIVLAALEEIMSALGPGSYLHGTEEYGRLSKVVRVCQRDRLEVIRVYREFAKAIRDRAKRAVVSNSELKTVGDELRKMTQEILRKRYYLEGDWGGETPLREAAD